MGACGRLSGVGCARGVSTQGGHRKCELVYDETTERVGPPLSQSKG